MAKITKDEFFETNNILNFKWGHDIYPWLTLKDVLKAEEMTYNDLAKATWFSTILIAQICTNKRRINIPFAVALQEQFKVSATFWLNLQRAYDLSKYFNNNYK